MLRQLLTDAGLDVRAFAKAVGVHENAAHRFVSGKATPRADTLRRYADELSRITGRPVPELLDAVTRRYSAKT